MSIVSLSSNAAEEKEKHDKLISDNLGLVHLCANRFRGRGIEYEELYSAGCVGAVKAANAFDETRGVKFSTYAVPVIMGEIRRLFRDGGTVKVSRSLKELSMRITREKSEFVAAFGREPTISELAMMTEQSEEKIAEALSAAMPCISLTRSSDDDDETGQQDIPSDFRESDIYESIALKQVMAVLSPEDRRLIYLRYYRSRTQTETAAALGMTQVQVSRREKKILEMMRKELI